MYPGPHCANRLFEWIVALIMLGVAGTLFMPGDSLQHSSMGIIKTIGLTDTSAGAILAVTGLFRAFALWANGAIPIWGARIRVGGSILGAIIWFQITVLLSQASFIEGVPLVGVPLFGFMTLGELISCYRARHDS